MHLCICETLPAEWRFVYLGITIPYFAVSLLLVSTVLDSYLMILCV